MDAMNLARTRYQACAGRIVGVTTTKSGTLLTVRLVRPPDTEAVEPKRWIGEAVEVLVMQRDDDPPSG